MELAPCTAGAGYIAGAMTGERAARPWLRPRSAVEAPSRATQPKDGVNVVGYLGAEAGIGEAARLIIEGLRAASVPVTALDFAVSSPSRQRHPTDGVAPLGVGGPVARPRRSS
jgi:hypothetical protein